MRRLLPIVVLIISACRTFEPAKSPDRALVELAPQELPTFADDLDYADLDGAASNSLEYFARLLKADPQASVPFGTEPVPVTKLVQTLQSFRALVAMKPTPADLRTALLQNFRVFQSTGGNREREVLFTGYYLPEVHGAWREQDGFKVPVYGLPPDLVTAKARDFPQLDGEDLVGSLSGGTIKPFPDRAQIAGGALKGRGLELVWLDSAIDAFFLEIQGSGIVRFRDGTTRVLTYAGKNGHRYTAIGQELIRRGDLKKEDVSAQSIRAWLNAHLQDSTALLNTNPSQVFFRISPAAEGAIATPLTAGRTIAADGRVFPKGALAFVEAERPENAAGNQWRKFSRFVLDQDTGGAIRTAAHVDVFWGSGDYAATAAGRMKQSGKLYYLLAK
jgi:membrane-bound lytic murein transglycosylase A